MKEQEGKVLIIAEIGTAHGGDIGRARELVDAAAEAGADCAKFQIVYADEILHPDTGFVSLPGGQIRLYDRFRELEVDPAFFAEIARYCGQKGLLFLASPFGLRSARELRELCPPFIKIASPELNHLPLLRETAGYGIPLILSTGVSRLADIETALAETEPAPERILLHCITSYPAPEEEYNLALVANLKAIFGVRVGVSDHSLDPVLVPALATACGACMIEKHITLSRAGSGLDDPVALDPGQFSQMVHAVRAAENEGRENVIRELAGRYGAGRVEKALGTGQKKLAKSEEANYTRTNRSIHYLRDRAKGETVRPEDVALLRTEKVLNPGLPPRFLETVTGASLAKDVKSGDGMRWEDLLILPGRR